VPEYSRHSHTSEACNIEQHISNEKSMLDSSLHRPCTIGAESIAITTDDAACAFQRASACKKETRSFIGVPVQEAP
jgi:hypothetical protein